MNIKSKIGRTILEINAVSFKHYLGIYLILLVLDIWKKNFVFNYFHFHLNWLLGFVFVSGLFKLFFNLDTLIARLENHRFRFVDKLLKFFYFLKSIKKYFLKIPEWLFGCSLIFYLLLLLIEDLYSIQELQKYFFFYKGPIARFLTPKIGRMSLLLGLVVLLGAVSWIVEKVSNKPIKESSISAQCPLFIRCKGYFFVIILGMILGGLIFYKTKELGWPSYPISIISALLIILLSVIILNEKKYEEH